MSLKLLLATIAGFAVGFGVCRSPTGDWSDIPLAVLSAITAFGLTQEIGRSPEPSSYKSRRRIAAALLFLLALSWVLRAAALQKIVLISEWYEYIDAPQDFPTALTWLVILVTLSLGRCGDSATATPLIGRRWLDYLGPVSACAWLWIFAISFTLVTALVHIAVVGIEVSSTAIFPEVRNTFDYQTPAKRLMVVAFFAAVLVAINFLTIQNRFASSRDFRELQNKILWIAPALLLQCVIAWWIMVSGIRSLAVSYSDEFFAFSPDRYLLLGILVLLAGFLLALRASTNLESRFLDSAQEPERRIQETVGFAAFVGILGFARFAYGPVEMYLESQRVLKETGFNLFTWDWRTMLSSLFEYPSQILPLAAAIAGCMSAWKRFRHRREPLITPSIDTRQLVALTALMTVFMISAGPIFFAIGFMFWLSPLPRLFP